MRSSFQLAGRFLPGSGRGLADCCASAGIELTRTHSALHDARAAATLLAHFIAVAGAPPPWHCVAAHHWPSLHTADVSPVLRRAEGHVESHFLSRLVERLPRTHNPNADAYLDVLDRALLDRHISVSEADALVSVACGLGLGRHDVLELHRDYLQALAAVAASDGTITSHEERDLQAVAALLGLDGGQLDRALRTARHATGLRLAGGAPADAPKPFGLRAGDTVVFTGDVGEPREVWEVRATRAGLRVGGGVTKQTRMLVAADPDSMSGKAQKAARYGIPIVHPRAFTEMLDTM